MSNINDFSPLWGEWHVKELLGKGSFGAVYKAEKQEYGTTYTCAIKHIQIPFEGFDEASILSEGLASDEESLSQYYKKLLNKLLTEINTCYQLKGHTNIVSYEGHSVVERPEGKGYDVFIRMEYLTSLSEFMRQNPFDEREVVKLGIDVCNGLKVMDKRNMIHRDIKPANIMVTEDGIYKIGDFSEARMITQNMGNMSIRGTYSYMAPEILKGQTANKTVDIYSVGLLLYRLLNNNKPPFTGDASVKLTSDLSEQSNAMRFRGEVLPPPANCTNQILLNAILKACEYNPHKRWQNADELCEQLQLALKSIDSPGMVVNPGMMNQGQANSWQNQAMSSGWGQMSASNFSAPNTNYGIPNQAMSNQAMSLGGQQPIQNNNQIVIPKKKKSAGVIIGIIVALLLVVAITVGVILLTRDDSDDKDKDKDEDVIVQNDSEEDVASTGDASDEEKDTEEEKTEATTEEVVEEYSMPFCENQPYEQIKMDLEDMGMVVTATYEYNDNVQSGYVISQGVAEGVTIQAGTEISFVVSNGPTPCPYEYEQKVTVTAASGSSNATLTLYEWQSGEWKALFTCEAKVGANGIGSDYGEGKKITPAGTFKLGVILTDTQPSGNMPYQIVSSSTCIVDDVTSPLYNIICDTSQVPSGVSCDTIGNNITGGKLSAAIFIEHNGNGYTSENVVPGRCSVITICGCEYSPIATAGCVDITSTSMATLMSLLNADKNPYIELYAN